MTETGRPPIEIGLTAAIVAVADRQPLILVVASDDPSEPDGLPFGPFDPILHRTLDMGLRAWVEEQTPLKLGYVEQLYTFGDRGRHAHRGDVGPHLVSVGYLALTRIGVETVRGAVARRRELAAVVRVLPLGGLARRPPRPSRRRDSPGAAALGARPFRRRSRAAAAQPARARPPRLRRRGCALGRGARPRPLRAPLLGRPGAGSDPRRPAGAGRVRCRRRRPASPMRFDHRRILATAISRLRAKLKYRPVVFELMAPEFSLTELQHTVEAISGRHVHKQNFRRLVEAARAGRADRGREPAETRPTGRPLPLPPRRAQGAPLAGAARRLAVEAQVGASLPPLARSMSSIRRRVMTPTRKKPNSGFW